MIVFVKADGSVQSVLPSPVYQGSSLEGSLYFVAPFPATNAVDVAFIRANGDVIGKYGLTRVTSGLPDVLDKLGAEYNVWEWQASNADVTAYAGEVLMQFRVTYAGQTLATASTKFTVQEGVIPQPVKPSADQWDTLIELYSRLNAKVPDVFLTDIAISEPNEDNIVTVTKYYNNGTTATEEFPAGGASFSVKSEWVKVIDFTTSAWVNASSGSGYEIAFPPSQTGYTDNKFLTSLESTETGGYSTLADTVFKGSDGSVLISATEKYSGRLVTLGGGIWGGVNVTAGSGEDSVQQVGGALANGKQSAALGFGTVAGSDYETVVGQYNVERTDAQFQVGNGTDENNRKDAFVVLKDGRAKVQTAPSDSDDVVRKDDLGYEIDFPFGGPTEVRCDSTDGITVTGTMRIYLNQAKTVFHDVSNVSVEIPIFAGQNVTIDADETNKKAVVKVEDMGSYGVDIGVGLPASATNGVLTPAQLALLQSSENNYIMFQHEKYYLEDKGHVEGYITYTHTGYENSTYWIKSITVTVSTRAWVLNKGGLAGKGLNFDADGKLQVKAGANLSFGADGSLNAVGSQGSEYANTSEIVDNAITLTSTSTLDDLVTQILAQKTKVMRASWNSNFQRIIPLPALAGPPDELYDVYFKVWSDYPLAEADAEFERRIDCFATYGSGSDGRWDFRGYINGRTNKYFSGWVSECNPYPIGAIFIAAATAGSYFENNPANCFGGTWEYIEEGRFLLSATPPESEDPAGQAYPAGSTGGSADAVVVSHRHLQTVSPASGTTEGVATFEAHTLYGQGAGSAAQTTIVGVDGTGKNMPPYLAVCMWKRIA